MITASTKIEIKLFLQGMNQKEFREIQKMTKENDLKTESVGKENLLPNILIVYFDDMDTYMEFLRTMPLVDWKS